MAQHEPNMVPTLAQHPRSAQHWQKWGRRSQNCTLLFCKSKIGFAQAPSPPPHPSPRAKLHHINSLRCSSAFRHSCPTKANTNHKIPLKWPNMSPIWCRHSPQWPNISPRSGKHSLTAACPKKETKTKTRRRLARERKRSFFKQLWVW